jgi:dTDP-4-dehydrorhamnose reductase
MASERGIFNLDKLQEISPIKSSALKSKVVRPLNSHLDCSTLEKNFNFSRTTWQQQTQHIFDLIVSKQE